MHIAQAVDAQESTVIITRVMNKREERVYIRARSTDGARRRDSRGKFLRCCCQAVVFASAVVVLPCERLVGRGRRTEHECEDEVDLAHHVVFHAEESAGVVFAGSFGDGTEAEGVLAEFGGHKFAHDCGAGGVEGVRVEGLWDEAVFIYEVCHHVL